MFPELFSKRYQLKPTSEGLMHDNVPKSARIGLCYILDIFQNIDKISLYKNICFALRISMDTLSYVLGFTDTYAHLQTIELIKSCEWWQFYDICEIIFTTMVSQKSLFTAQFSSYLNQLFADEFLGFRFNEGKIEKVGSGFIDVRIQEARYLLKETEFKGADVQFEKALKALNVRPNSDVENCVKDAVSAIESVGRIITKDDKALLSDIVKDLAKKGIIPKPLDEAIQKVYAYRGNEPGVAHGLVGESKVTIDEAEFILAMSAAIIIYLVKKRSNY
ncbi:MAG: hypothetical protein ABIB93_04115 [Chloroflexota bacterium]